MALYFVDNTAIDPKARKRIRSHVMRGKNLGRTVKRASRVDHSKLRKVDLQCTAIRNDNKDKEEEVIENSTLTKGIQRMVGHEFSTYFLPFQMSRENRKTVHQFFAIVSKAVYPHDYCNPFDVKKSIWVKYMDWAWDEAYFHCTLCMMDACSDFFLDRSTPSPAAIGHLSQAIQLVNSKLASGEALSDKTIFVVLGLTIHEQLRDDRHKWKIHFNGLCRLVELRGGLTQLVENRGLVEKICRIDISFALSTGCSTHFRLDEIPFITNMALKATAEMDSDLEFVNDFPAMHNVLRDIVRGTMALVRRLSNLKHRKLDSYTFQATMITLCYRLIDFSSLRDSRILDAQDQGIYLGLMAFMTTFMFQFGWRRLLHHHFLSKQFKAFIKKKDEDATGENSLLLWLLFISHCSSVFGEDDEDWMYLLIVREAQSLGITTWDDLYECLIRYPWVSNIYDISAQELWTRAKGTGHEYRLVTDSVQSLIVAPKKG